MWDSKNILIRMGNIEKVKLYYKGTLIKMLTFCNIHIYIYIYILTGPLA